MAQTDRNGGFSGDVAIKIPCRVATTTNIAHYGLLTVDGVVLAAGDRVLDKDNTDATLRGIWVASETTWARASDFDGARDITHGTLILITSGNTYANFVFQLTTDNPVIGTSSLTFIDQTPSSLASLAASDGSSLVGFIQPGTGAVARTMQSKARESISVKDFGAVGDGVTDDTAAIQAAIVAIEASATNKIVFFPAGEYKLASGVVITESGISLIGESAGRTNLNGTVLSFTGASGTCITVGADDSNPWDGTTFDGPQRFSLKNITLKIVAPTTPLPLGFGDYTPNTMALRMWRSSYQTIENVLIEGFETGVWLNQSNNSTWKDLAVNYCLFGVYVGPRVYVLNSLGLSSLYCNTGIKLDKSGIRLSFIGSSYTHCGTDTTQSIEILRGASNIFFDGLYLEHNGGYTGATNTAFMSIGTTNGYNGITTEVHDVKIKNLYIGTSAPAATYHTQYLAYLDKVYYAEIDCFSGTNSWYGNLDYFLSCTGNQRSILIRSPRINKDKWVTGTATDICVEFYGNAAGIGSTYGLIEFRDFDAAADGTNLWQFNMTAANAVVLDKPDYASGQTRRLYIRRSWKHDAAAPVSGTYEQGDIIWDSAPAASGTIGWVCVAGGTPGTWKTFGVIAA